VYFSIDRFNVPVRIRDATFAVIDVETTGIDPVADRVVEVACVRIRAGRQIASFTSLVDPGRPIPDDATRVHRITDHDVQGGPSLAALEPTIALMCAGAVVVAHNARFDLTFLPFLSTRPILCTMALAMRLLPQAPNYKNQTLREYLHIDGVGAEGSTAHRALVDAQVTAGILGACLERYLVQDGVDDVERLISDLRTPQHLPILPFGPYRGVPIAEVPTDYLRQLSTASQSPFLDAPYTAAWELKRRAIAS
jgi:exodeoxyribonuclease X